MPAVKKAAPAAKKEDEPTVAPTAEPVVTAETTIADELADQVVDQADGTVVEELSVERVEHAAAVLVINGQRFVLSPTQAAVARKGLEVAGYELY